MRGASDGACGGSRCVECERGAGVCAVRVCCGRGSRVGNEDAMKVGFLPIYTWLVMTPLVK